MSASVIKLICPNLQCRKVLSVPVQARGKNVRCRACGIRVTVPGKKKAVQTVFETNEEQTAQQETTDEVVVDGTEAKPGK